MKQFEIRWTEVPKPAGDQPDFILQEVPLGPAEGTKKACVANLDNLRTVARSWLVKRAWRISERRQAEVKCALGAALEWEELILPVE